MLISKVSGLGFNGKNINPKKVQSTAEKIYSHGANLEETLVSKETKNVTKEIETYYPFASSTGDSYIKNATEKVQDNVKDEAHEYLSASMILKKDVKKKV